MVEWGALEMRCTCERTGGSNPSLSAIFHNGCVATAMESGECRVRRPVGGLTDSPGANRVAACGTPEPKRGVGLMDETNNPSLSAIFRGFTLIQTSY